MPEIHERQGAAYNPVTHFVLLPLFLLSFGFGIYMTVEHWRDNPVVYPWLTVLSFALLLVTAQSRLYTLRVQDRIIRLEEQLRIASLLLPDQFEEVKGLSTSQLIGLRFASDAELPVLALRAAREGLNGRQIKQFIAQWRRDDARV